MAIVIITPATVSRPRRHRSFRFEPPRLTLIARLIECGTAIDARIGPRNESRANLQHNITADGTESRVRGRTADKKGVVATSEEKRTLRVGTVSTAPTGHVSRTVII